MSLHRWLQNLRSALALSRCQRHRGRRGSLPAASHRPNLEVLEDRLTPSFSTAVNYPVGRDPGAVTTVDFNNDGHLDLVTANHSDNTVSVLLGNTDGTFQPALTSAAGTDPTSVAVGDFNADGQLDLVTANRPDYMSAENVSVLLGNGNGTFQAPNNIDVGPIGNMKVAVGDFNGDGKLDLAASGDLPWSYYASYGAVNVLLGIGDGSFSSPITSVTEDGGQAHDNAVVGDFNGDGKLDLAVLETINDHVLVMLGDGQGHLHSQGRRGTGNTPVSVAAGDVNGDGKLDVVTGNVGDGNLTVLLGDGVGGFATSQNYAGGHSLVLGDFNRDGWLDLATGYNKANILRGHGDGTFSTAQNVAAIPDASVAAAGDFNGDGWLDLAALNETGNSVSVLINDQSWSSPPQPSVSVSDATVTEGNTDMVNATFTLTLSSTSNVAVTVHYETEDISAAAGSDYAAASGDVIIPAGHTSATFTVAVRGDRLAEPNETFAVNLTAATNATIADSQGIGTIVDDEPRISISDVSKKEGKKNQTTQFTFTVTLSAAYDQAVTLSYQTANGTATTGDGDYVAQSGTITFKPGEKTKTITIVVNGDSKKEADENFYLDLFGLSSNALFTKKRGIGTILDDD